jgi:transcriptional regulator with XRE-family HTH domain
MRGGRQMRSFHSEAYQEFLVRWRRAREDAGLTQEEVAKRLGRPQSYVSKCESGERRVDVIELVDFAKLYGQRLDFFLPSPAVVTKSRS